MRMSFLLCMPLIFPNCCKIFDLWNNWLFDTICNLQILVCRAGIRSLGDCWHMLRWGDFLSAQVSKSFQKFQWRSWEPGSCSAVSGLSTSCGHAYLRYLNAASHNIEWLCHFSNLCRLEGLVTLLPRCHCVQLECGHSQWLKHSKSIFKLQNSECLGRSSLVQRRLSVFICINFLRTCPRKVCLSSTSNIYRIRPLMHDWPRLIA